LGGSYQPCKLHDFSHQRWIEGNLFVVEIVQQILDSDCRFAVVDLNQKRVRVLRVMALAACVRVGEVARGARQGGALVGMTGDDPSPCRLDVIGERGESPSERLADETCSSGGHVI
jgi:hypothetical protein